MKKITVVISDDLARSLIQLTTQCNAGDQNANTHGKLDVPVLAAMLLEDAGMVIERPGSWEGSNMAQLLSSHGYGV